MTVGVTGLTHFIVWRFIFQQPRRVSEMTDHFDITIDRMNALLRKLGFVDGELRQLDQFRDQFGKHAIARQWLEAWMQRRKLD